MVRWPSAEGRILPLPGRRLAKLFSTNLHGTTVFDVPRPLFGSRAVDDILSPAVAIFFGTTAGRSATAGISTATGTTTRPARSAACPAAARTGTTAATGPATTWPATTGHAVASHTPRRSALTATSRTRRLPRLSKQVVLFDLPVEFLLPLIGWQ
jgi:hypothetical protein